MLPKPKEMAELVSRRPIGAAIKIENHGARTKKKRDVHSRRGGGALTDNHDLDGIAVRTRVSGPVGDIYGATDAIAMPVSR